MTPQHVISQLLESDTKYPQNLDLLKKIIITAYLGRLRINGLAPDNQVSIGNYLFDNERMIFDFTRLSDSKREKFLQWLLEPHQKDKEISFFNEAFVNEYRGFTSEVGLSLWGRLNNWFQNRHSEQWNINDLELNLNYQLTGIELCHGKQGILLGFEQFLVPPSGTKYGNPEKENQRDPFGNTKRVFITDMLVDKLIHININKFKPSSLCKRPHPQSISVVNPVSRFEEMYSYRLTQKFITPKPWYVRLWSWIVSWFKSEKPGKQQSSAPTDSKLTLLYNNETTEVFQRNSNKEIIVKERRPNIENLVLCGGGPKIFAHVGVWKALNERNIRPTRFAGSSAGAIMSLMCYLGYNADEIAELFKNFRQEHLVHFNIDRKGLSDSHSLKTALDFAVINKVKQITSQYKIPFPQGTITFRTLEALRQQCPDCGLGTELIVTATNKRLQNTSYFSLARTPDMEVSDAVKTSALFPVVYRESLVNGDEHSDGGLLSNFPTEVFSDDHSTFLESEYGNNLKVLAVQFNNGTERSAIDRIMENVYKEPIILEWIYRLITGVKETAVGWELDRLKLRQYAMQTIVPDTDDAAVSGFSVEEESQVKMIASGYQSTMDYLDVRYGSKNGCAQSQERMYSTFSSLGDLLAYCCYRGDKHWFDIVNNLILNSSLSNRAALMKLSIELRELYFKRDISVEDNKEVNPQASTFCNNEPPKLNPDENESNQDILLALYPLFLKLSPDFVVTRNDKKILENARHSLSLHAPFSCLEQFEKITGNEHVMLHILIVLLKQLKENPSEDVYSYIKELQKLLYTNTCLKIPAYFGQWDLSLPQCIRVLKFLNKGDHNAATQLLGFLKERLEPMQVIKNNKFVDDFNEGTIEESITGFTI